MKRSKYVGLYQERGFVTVHRIQRFNVQGFKMGSISFVTLGISRLEP